MKQKITVISILVAMLSVIVAGGTIAYFMDTDSANNVFTLGNIDIALHEDDGKLADEDKPDYEGDEAYREWLKQQLLFPELSVQKNTWVENNGKNPAFVRAYVLYPEDLAEMLILKYDESVGDKWIPVKDTSKTKADGEVIGTVTRTIDDVKYVGVCYNWFEELSNEAGKNITTDLLTSVMLNPLVECDVQANGNTVYSFNGKEVAMPTNKEEFFVRVIVEAGQTRSDDVKWSDIDYSMNTMFGVPEKYVAE